MNRLGDHGLLIVDAGPASHVVRLNRDHVATEPAIALANLRPRVLTRLRDEVAGWSLPAVHVSLFGSVARGDGTTQSDIDLLVVRRPLASVDDQEVWDDQLAQSADAIHRWTGNWASWFDITDEDLARLAEAREPIVREWQHDAVTLLGPRLLTLLRRAS